MNAPSPAFVFAAWRFAQRPSRHGGCRVLGLVLMALGAVGALGTFTGFGGLWAASAAWACALVGSTCLCFSFFQPAFASALVGIALGVTGQISVSGVASGVEWVLTSRLGSVNGHVLVTKYGLDFFEYEEVASALQKNPEVLGTSPFAYGIATISAPLDSGAAAPGEEDPVARRGPKVMMLKGVLPTRAASFPGFEGIFDEGSATASLRPANPNEAPGLVVGRALAEKMGAGIGDEVVLAAPHPLDGSGEARGRPPRHAKFEITGIVSTGMRDLDARVGLCHLTAAQALLFGEGRVTGVEAYLSDAQRAPEIAERTVAMIQPAKRERLYRANTWIDQGSELLELVRRTRIAVQAALSLLLLVAAANLVGALIVLMRSRASQIATLGMLGATPRMQGHVFAGIGFGMGILGGLLGVALACLASVLIAHANIGLDPTVYGVETLSMRPSLADVLVPWVVALALCMVGTGPVAWAAGRLAPLDALRRT